MGGTTHSAVLATTPVRQVTCEVAAITSEAALRSLKCDWESLQRDTADRNVFTTWGWMWSWWQSFGRHEPATTMFIITVRQAGRLTAVLPLVRRPTRWGHLRKLEFPDLVFADRMDPLTVGDADPQLTSIFSFLAARHRDWDLLILRRLRAESGIADRVSEALAHSDLLWRTRKDEAYLFLPISTCFERMKSPASAQTHRRKVRRMVEAGVRYRIVEHPEREERLIERMAALERKRMVGDQPAGLLLAEHCGFFRQIFTHLGPDGWLYIGVLEQGTELVAYELGFRCANKLWVYTKGFDPKFAKLSPGNLLTAAVIDYGFENEFVEYDLLRGREEFKQRLTDRKRGQVRFEIWNRAARSEIAARLFFGLRVVLISKWWQLRHQPVHPDL